MPRIDPTERLEYQREWYKKNPGKRYEAQWTHRLKHYYGITPAEYCELLEKQGGVCAVCGNAQPHGVRLCIDHDHETGAIRGLLCTNCNRAIGSAKNDPGRLRKLAGYLEKFTEVRNGSANERSDHSPSEGVGSPEGAGYRLGCPY